MRSITDCIIVLKPGDTIDLLGRSLGGYAILPQSTFFAMGGTEHPAYQEAVEARRAADAAEHADRIAALNAAAATPAGRIEELEREIEELRGRIDALEVSN